MLCPGHRTGKVGRSRLIYKKRKMDMNAKGLRRMNRRRLSAQATNPKTMQTGRRAVVCKWLSNFLSKEICFQALRFVPGGAGEAMPLARQDDQAGVGQSFYSPLRIAQGNNRIRVSMENQDR